MVKHTQVMSDLPWLAIFSVIVYFIRSAKLFQEEIHEVNLNFRNSFEKMDFILYRYTLETLLFYFLKHVVFIEISKTTTTDCSVKIYSERMQGRVDNAHGESTSGFILSVHWNFRSWVDQFQTWWDTWGKFSRICGIPIESHWNYQRDSNVIIIAS